MQANCEKTTTRKIENNNNMKNTHTFASAGLTLVARSLTRSLTQNQSAMLLLLLVPLACYLMFLLLLSMLFVCAFCVPARLFIEARLNSCSFVCSFVCAAYPLPFQTTPLLLLLLLATAKYMACNEQCVVVVVQRYKNIQGG